MARSAILSKHIVLTELQDRSFSYPVAGIILILDGLISDIIIIESDYCASTLLEKYSSWNPVDYSDHYISPGIIDLSTKIEWESYEQLTKESLKGGATCIAVEPGHYASETETQSLFCDLCKIFVIDDSTLLSDLPKSISALKLYLFPPSPNVKSIANLDNVLKNAHSSGIPLIVDPNMPDPRMLYMASPHRLETLEERGRTDLSSGSTVFAAAFPENMESESSPSESIGSDSDCPLPMKSNSLQSEEIKVIFSHKRSASGEKIKFEPLISIIEEEDTDAYSKSTRKNSYDIYHDLDERIKESQHSIEDLCKAETSTYKFSGSTNFIDILPKKSYSMKYPESNLDKSPELQPETGKRKTRPAPIQIKTAVKPDTLQDYNYFLANCPESWEITGVEKVLEYTKQNYSIHFTGLSSAGAINKIRHIKKKFKNLSCEIQVSHLCFTSVGVPPGDCRFKTSPPIRNQGNCNLLWDLLKIKGIDCVTSGHTFIEPKLKLTQNFQQSVSGIANAGLLLGSVWNMINVPVSRPEQLEHYIVRLAKWLSLCPAKVLNVDKERGKIDKGLRADLIVWDPYFKDHVSDDYTYASVSPFSKCDVMGKILKVYIKGTLACSDGNVLDPLGTILRFSA